MTALPAETVTVEGITLNNVHDVALCSGRPCVVHNPTDHHMRGFRLLWRNDRAIFERICPHGIGHPDPDQYAYWLDTLPALTDGDS